MWFIGPFFSVIKTIQSINFSKCVNYQYRKQRQISIKTTYTKQRSKSVEILKHNKLEHGDCMVINQFVVCQNKKLFIISDQEKKIGTKMIINIVTKKSIYIFK